MKNTALLLLCFILNISLLFAQNNCPNSIDGFSSLGEFNGHSYYLSSQSYNYNAAKAHIQTLDINGYIVSINDEEENEFIKNQIGNNIVLIGYNDAQSEGNFVWDSGETIDYTNISGTNSTDRDYATINFWAGSWDFVNAITAKKYILEVPCGNTGEASLEITNVSCPTQFPQANGTLSYVVEITNNGNVASDPETLSFARVLNGEVGGVFPTGDQITISSIPPTSTQSFNFDFTFEDIELPGDCAGINTFQGYAFTLAGNGTETLDYYCQKINGDLEIFLTTNDNSYGDDGVVNFDINIRNRGTSNVYNILSDFPFPVIPSHYDFGTPSTGELQFQSCFGGNRGRWYLPTLNANESAVLNVTANLNDIFTTLPDTWTVTRTVTSGHLLDNFPQNNTDVIQFTKSTGAELEIIDVSCPDNFPIMGQTLTYDVSIANNGSASSTPTTLQIIDAVVNPNIYAEIDIPAIPAGVTQIFSISQTLQNNLTPGDLLDDNTFFGAYRISLDGNDFFTRFYCKKYSTDIEIAISSSDLTYGDDGIINYTVQIQNNGNEVAYNVGSGFRPPSLAASYTLSTPSLGIIKSFGDDANVSWYIPILQVGESATLNVTEDLTTAAGGLPDIYGVTQFAGSGHLMDLLGNDFDPNPDNNQMTLVFNKEDEPTDCPTSITGFTSLGEFNDHKYFISNTSANWPTAHAVAAANNAYLASINSAEENDFIKNQLGNDIVLIGYNDAQSEGNFVWDSGESVSYTNVSGNNSQDDDYATMNFWAGSWDFVNGLTAKKYILEVPCNSTNAPALEITDVSCPSEFPQANTTLNYELTITNTGSATSDPDTLRIAERRNGFGAGFFPSTDNQIPIPPLNAGETIVVNFQQVYGANITLVGDCTGANTFAGYGFVLANAGQINDFPFYDLSPVDFYCNKVNTDISVELTTDNLTYGSDGELNYTMTINNNGNEDAYNVISRFPFLFATSANSIFETPTDGFIEFQGCSGGQVPNWKIPVLASGASASIVVSVSLYTNNIPDDYYVIQSANSGHVIDNNPANNIDTLLFTLSTEASLAVNCPGSYSEQATVESPNGMILNWPVPTGTTTCSGNVTITQLAGPPSGSFINALSTAQTIVYEISDDCGNSEICSFEIEVIPLPTTRICPNEDIVVVATSSAGAVVTYEDMSLITSCTFSPEPTLLSGLSSGSVFPIGTTVVLQGIFTGGSNTYCSNQEVCSFNVTVLPQSGEAVLEITDVSCPNEFPQTGSSSTYNITVTNIGNGSSTPQILGLYQSRYSFFTESTTQFLIASADLNSIPAGGSVQVSLEVFFDESISLSLGGSVGTCNASTAYSPYLFFDDGNDDPFYLDRDGEIDFTCKKYTTDLELNLSTNDPTYGDDGILNYTVSITNNGAETAYNVYSIVAGNIFRAGGLGEGCLNNGNTTIQGSISTPSVGYINSSGGQLARWNIPVLEIGQTATVNVSYQAYPFSIPTTGSVNASVTSFHLFDGPNNNDPILDNNMDQLSFTYEPDPTPCPNSIAGFQTLGEFDNHKYFISDDAENWNTAQSIANSLGGYLVSINSVNENNFIKNHISEIVLIGSNDALSEGNVVWDSGEPLDYTNYADCSFCGLNNSENDYGTMLNWDGTWGFVNEFVTKKFIVEIPCGSSASCSIDGQLVNSTCSDAGTPQDPSDDQLRITLTAIGNFPSGQWIAKIPNADGTGTFYEVMANFNAYYGIGIPIAGIDQYLGGIVEIEFRDSQDPSCTDMITIQNIATCSNAQTLPDLRIIDINLPTTEADQGDVVEYFFDFRNSGLADVVGDYTIGAYLSTDIFFDESQDILVGEIFTGNTAIGLTEDVLGSITIPTDLTPGDYHFVLKADINNDIIEINENNNVAITAATININSTNPTEGIDLELNIAPPNPAILEVYENYVFTITLSNNGISRAENIIVSIPIPEGFAYSGSTTSDGNYQNWTGEWSISNLDANSSEVLNLDLFSLTEANPITLYGEVIEMDDTDIDSTPNNGNGTTAQEDDEAIVVVSPILARSTALLNNTLLRIDKVFPNPAADELILQISSQEARAGFVEIYNSQATLQMRQAINLLKGQNTIKLNLSQLTSGTYVIHIPGTQTKQSNIRFIKQRK